MMQIDVLGFEYDDAAPAFSLITEGQYYYHYRQSLMFSRVAFDASLAAQGKTFGPKEVGAMPANWKVSHETIVQRSGGGMGLAPITLAPLSAATKINWAAPSTVTVNGGPSDADKTIIVELQGDAGDLPFYFSAQVSKGDTAQQVAAALLVAFGVHANLAATVAGAVLTVTPGAGHRIHLLDHTEPTGHVTPPTAPAVAPGTGTTGLVGDSQAAVTGLALAADGGGGGKSSAHFEVAVATTIIRATTIKISYRVDDTGAVLQTVLVPLTVGMTGAQVHTAVVAAVNGESDMSDGGNGAPHVVAGPTTVSGNGFSYFYVSIV